MFLCVDVNEIVARGRYATIEWLNLGFLLNGFTTLQTKRLIVQEVCRLQSRELKVTHVNLIDHSTVPFSIVMDNILSTVYIV